MKHLLIILGFIFAYSSFAQYEVKMTKAMSRELTASINDYFGDLPVKNIIIDKATTCNEDEECEYFIDATVFARAMGGYTYVNYDCWTTIDKIGRKLIANTTTCDY